MALFSGHAMSQTTWLGLKGGLSIPDLSGGGGNPLSENYTSRLALNFGVLSDFTVHKNLPLQVELNYAGQGGKRDGIQPITNTCPPACHKGPGRPPKPISTRTLRTKLSSITLNCRSWQN